MKLLVPNYAIGALIGKAGATITQIQANTGTRIKLSQVRAPAASVVEHSAFASGLLLFLICSLFIVVYLS